MDAALDPVVFDAVRALVHQRAGIAIADSKVALVSARLSQRLRALGLTDARAYLKLLSGPGSEDELVLLLDAISTNTTSFFREESALLAVVDLFRQRLAAGQTRFRIWCAASSTGEEPYSLAMLFDDAAKGRAVDLAMLATDISTRVLERCRAGIYPAECRTRIPAALHRYLQPHGADTIQIDPRLRALITFNRLNLNQQPFPMKGPFDAILCRNVMIYFDQGVRSRLVTALARLLTPGGLLAIGAAESLSGLPHSLTTVRPAVYRR